MKHLARKRFGQNFLHDQGVIQAIVSAIQPTPGDNLIEIGPGLAALTRPLLESAGHLTVVEIDRDLVTRLQNGPLASRLTIRAGDALEVDFSQFGQALRLVGNLPYNISTPLLFHLSRFYPLVRDMHFMLQKEVVDRIVAQPSTPDYGRLSVMLQYRFQTDHLLDVPPTAFDPPPKVDSAVVRLIPYTQPPFADCSESTLSALVQQAFSQRRKTLRNTLKGFCLEDDLQATGIDPQARAEEISVTQYAALAARLSPASAT